jgi:hypothetical protein
MLVPYGLRNRFKFPNTILLEDEKLIKLGLIFFNRHLTTGGSQENTRCTELLGLIEPRHLPGSLFYDDNYWISLGFSG